MKLGEMPKWSCTPYYQGSVPRLGHNIAWAESSAVSFANSVLGARTEQDSGRYSHMCSPDRQDAQIRFIPDGKQTGSDKDNS